MRAGKYVPKADNLNFERAWNFNEAICSSHPGATRNLIWPLYGQDRVTKKKVWLGGGGGGLLI